MINRLIYIVAFVTLSNIAVNAQLSSSTKDYSLITKYLKQDKSAPIEADSVAADTVYIFFDKLGSLTANNSFGINATFTWEKYNNTSNTFEFYSTVTGTSSSLLNDLRTGGYKVSISDGINPETSYRAWIFEDPFVVEDIFVVNECKYLSLSPTIKPGAATPYTYYDLSVLPNFPINIKNDQASMTIKWTSSEAANIFENNAILNQNFTKPALLKVATYSISVTDVFGKLGSFTTGTIAPIATETAFKLTLKEHEKETNIDLTNDKVANNKTAFKGEAPLYIDIENKSLNASQWDWKFYMSENLRTSDNSLLLSQQEETPAVSDFFYTPGLYKIKLITKNTFGCTDSAVYSVLKVDSSIIAKKMFPNVFTPDGDDSNPVFKFLEGEEENAKSLKSFSIDIFTKGGSKVYSYTGDRREWEGWNGKKDNSGSEQPSGIYYYTIRATGWDNREFIGKSLTGFVYLFR